MSDKKTKNRFQITLDPMLFEAEIEELNRHRRKKNIYVGTLIT